jgi:hypothetical protein
MVPQILFRIFTAVSICINVSFYDKFIVFFVYLKYFFGFSPFLVKFFTAQRLARIYKESA